MAAVGHQVRADGRSVFRVYAPQARTLAVQLLEPGGLDGLPGGSHHGRLLPLHPAGDADLAGYWTLDCERLPHGSLYWLVLDGRHLPDPASRCQPQGVHGPSMVVDIEPVASPGWTGVAMADAVIYELHVGTFTPAGTLAAAQGRLDHLAELGINVVELMPLAAFPGERNWGYDGTCLYALHAACGSYADLKAYVEAAHARGIAVILDVVYNHFGPEGNYSGAFAPYTKAAATPWGAAINFDDAWNHGVREFFLGNLRHWLEDVGLDGVRMDAVSLIFDQMPLHILREFTDLARAIGRAQGREVLVIAEHLRNNRHVTSEQGYGYHAQWNDDLNHAVYAHLTGETTRHYANFGTFDDVVKALTHGFVLDGSRYDKLYQYYLGSDGRLTRPEEHVVHIQNHDQVGNRALGDRMITTHGRAKALLGLATVLASPYVPMLFMGEEYGETAPFLFFEDFGDAALVEAVRRGRRADFAFGNTEPPDPHARASFEASKLDWALAESSTGRATLAFCRALIALKRSGALGPRDRAQLQVQGDAPTGLITLTTARTLTVLNYSDRSHACDPGPAWRRELCSADMPAGRIEAWGVVVSVAAGRN
ncbi:MAG: putative malto-oligosyltrehalose trehalohydrolase [Pseudomonadota bacterium]|jgi:maltooligosyltrehalose trehalohydrolase